ncbi:MAG: hypothetical protein QW376_08455, partial [Candidatus Caldarchaeum sp.]
LMATTWSTPFRLGQIRANRLRLTPVLGSSQLGIQPKVIEQRDFSGKVAARLRITPGPSAGEFQFEVEDFHRQTPGRALGRGQIKPAGLSAVIKVNNRTQLSLDIRPGSAAPGQVRSTLSLDSLHYEFTIDVDKAKALASQMQQLVERKQEAAQLLLQICETLSPRKNYLAFASQAAISPASDVLNTTASLIMTAAREEISRNAALLAISFAVKIFAPWSLRAGGSNQTIGLAQQPYSLVKTNTAAVPTLYSAKPKLYAQTVAICCDACGPYFTAALVGCVFLDVLCAVSWSWPDWACWLLSGGCVAADIYFLVWCIENCVLC